MLFASSPRSCGLFYPLKEFQDASAYIEFVIKKHNLHSLILARSNSVRFEKKNEMLPFAKMLGVFRRKIIWDYT